MCMFVIIVAAPFPHLRHLFGVFFFFFFGGRPRHFQNPFPPPRLFPVDPLLSAHCPLSATQIAVPSTHEEAGHVCFPPPHFQPLFPFFQSLKVSSFNPAALRPRLATEIPIDRQFPPPPVFFLTTLFFSVPPPPSLNLPPPHPPPTLLVRRAPLSTATVFPSPFPIPPSFPLRPLLWRRIPASSKDIFGNWCDLKFA